MISAVIVENEIDHLEALLSLLKTHYPDIHTLCTCKSTSEAVQAINEHQPKLIFLNVEMPELNGFQLIDKVKPADFEIVLMSQHDKHAKDAMHCGAAGFLSKPVTLSDLKIAVEKAKQQIEVKSQQKLMPLMQKLQENLSQIQNVALPTLEGLQMVAVRSIIYCSSQGNYTNFILKDKQKLHVCRTLKQIEHLLKGYQFIRVHHSHIVNVNEVKKYIKGEGGSVIMSDETNINVSRSHKDLLLKTLQNGRS